MNTRTQTQVPFSSSHSLPSHKPYQKNRGKMALHERQTQKPRRKQPSFSSSLLDAIYRSIDEIGTQTEDREIKDFSLRKRNNGPHVEKEIESLRRAAMIEQWIETYRTSTHTPMSPGLEPSNSSSSSAESSMFSPTETESSTSKSTPKKLPRNAENAPPPADARKPPEAGPKREAIAKLRAHKIYRELKKAKEPISPGGKILNFLNSIFSPRNSKKNPGREEWSSSVVKSRSVNDTRTGSFASKSCLSKTQFSSRGNNSKSNNIIINNKKSKSTRSVRFCPPTVTVDEDCQPSGHNKGLYSEEYSMGRTGPVIGSCYIKRNIDSLGQHETKNTKNHDLSENYYYHRRQKEECHEFDEMMSCGSSDLFELEHIGRSGLVGMGAYEEELPVYGTTSFKILNHVIGNGFVV